MTFQSEVLDCSLMSIKDVILLFVSLLILMKQNLIKMDGCNEGGAAHDREK